MTTQTARPEPDFEQTAALADAALKEARRRGIPPEPHAFEVLYGYVSGVDEELSRSVEEVFRSDQATSLSAIDRIYEEHLAMGSAPNQFLRIGEQLGNELGEITELLGHRETSDAQYLGSLTKARDGISMFSRPGAVKQAVRELIDLSNEQVERTAKFGAELKAARSQVEDLTKELKVLRESAYLDHLTGVPNRRRLDVVLETEIATAATRGPLCFAMADIDFFKSVNDRFGHSVGDSVLQQFAKIMRQNLKGKDTPARYGGEEFAIVLPSTKLLGARHVTEKIRQALASKAFVVSGSKQPIGAITASFGVTQFRPGESAADMISRADALLYKAKESGRNRVISEE